MRVRVDEQRCQGHTMCAIAAPDIFVIDGEGYATVADPDVPAGAEASVRAAADVCPEQAIVIET